MKKNESSTLLLEIVHRNILSAVNDFRNSTLYLVGENMTPVELGEVIGKPVSEIIGFLAVFAILDIDLRRLILNMRAFLE